MSKKPIVKEVSYSMLRTTKQYENDRAECIVVVGGKSTQEDVDAAIEEAKSQCARALKSPDPNAPTASDVLRAVRDSGKSGITKYTLFNKLKGRQEDISHQLNELVRVGVVKIDNLRYISEVL